MCLVKSYHEDTKNLSEHDQSVARMTLQWYSMDCFNQVAPHQNKDFIQKVILAWKESYFVYILKFVAMTNPLYAAKIASV